MSFVIDKTVTDKPPKKTVVSQFTGNNSTIVYKYAIYFIKSLICTYTQSRNDGLDTEQNSLCCIYVTVAVNELIAFSCNKVIIR